MVYQEYIQAYEDNLFDIKNVNFISKIVLDTYTPDPSDTIKDPKNHIFLSGGALTGDVLVTSGMGEIMDGITDQLREDMQTDSESLFDEIEEMYEGDQEKIDELKNLIIFGVLEDDDVFWQNLKNEGVKYIIIESPTMGILCFCEEI